MIHPVPDASALSLQRIVKRFGSTTVVKDLTLQVDYGMVYGLLGPNGAGKTTTLRMVAGILLPDQGCIVRGGHHIDRATRGALGYLPEERGLYARMGVADQLAFFASLRGMGPREKGPAVSHWLDLLGLKEAANRRVDELSHGTQQLLQIAIALIHEPNLVVLDEPFSGLDPVHVGQLMELITGLKHRGTAVLLCTHAMEQAEQLCDRIGFLHRGTLRAEGSGDELRSQYGSSVLRLVFRGDVPADLALPHGVRGEARGCVVTAGLPSGQLPHDLIARLDAEGLLTAFEFRRASLREVFLRVVQ